MGFVSICTMAHAADVSSAYPVKAKTPPALAPDWTGFYIGPTVGWTFASSKGDYTGVIVNPPPLMVYYPFDLKPSGAAIGGLFGYNFRYARWLYGIAGNEVNRSKRLDERLVSRPHLSITRWHRTVGFVQHLGVARG